MSKPTKTSLKNHQHPLSFQGWYLDDALENPGVGALSRFVEIWKWICSFLHITLGHPLCQQQQKILLGTTGVLLESMTMLWRGDVKKVKKGWKSEESGKSEREKNKNWKKGKRWKSEKKWEKWERKKRKRWEKSENKLTDSLQNVHNYTQLDTSGYKWTPVDTIGLYWTNIDTGVHGWTNMDTSGHYLTNLTKLTHVDKIGQNWTLMDRTCGLYWTQVDTSEL